MPVDLIGAGTKEEFQRHNEERLRLRRGFIEERMRMALETKKRFFSIKMPRDLFAHEFIDAVNELANKENRVCDVAFVTLKSSGDGNPVLCAQMRSCY